MSYKTRLKALVIGVEYNPLLNFDFAISVERSFEWHDGRRDGLIFHRDGSRVSFDWW
jgi:hypothetical protein